MTKMAFNLPKFRSTSGGERKFQLRCRGRGDCVFAEEGPYELIG